MVVIFKMKQRRPSWSNREVTLLHQNYHQYNDIHFHNICNHLPNITPRQAQERWRMDENPNLDSNQTMTKEQLERLVNLVDQL
jgi:hypothetical protein